MRKRKLSSLAVFLSSIAISLFIPTIANAAEELDITGADVVIEEQKCNDNCQHIIKGTSTGQYTISITGNGQSLSTPTKKTHTVTLQGLTVDNSDPNATVTGFPAIRIANHAKVDLIIDGDVSLKGGYGCAGIYVETGSSLTIRHKTDDQTDKLTVTGGIQGAGIGGQGDDSPGDIIIESGTINATGGDMAAGIGCGQKGRCGQITIAGGVVTATGGKAGTINNGKPNADGSGFEQDPVSGGSGIGRGGLSELTNFDEANMSTLPKLVLSGGSIIAKGGAVNDVDGAKAGAGIDVPMLTSTKDGSTDIVATLENTRLVDFNGIIWDKTVNEAQTTTSLRNGTIYGSASLDKNVLPNERLVFGPDASLTIPILKDSNGDPITLQCAGYIDGTARNSIVGSIERTGNGNISDDIQRKVILQKQDFVMPTDLVYTAEDLTSKALEIKPERPIPGKTEGAEIVSDGWNYKLVWDGNKTGEASSILNAGTYEVSYSNTKYPTNNFSFDITVAQASLSDVVIKEIEPQTYTGKERTPALTVTFNNHPVSEADYRVAYTDNVNIGTATVTLRENAGNFKGTKAITYKIEPASLTGDNAEVSISSTKETYNGNEHKPDITVTSTTVLDDNDNPTKLVENTDYTITTSRDGEETTDYRSAGKIVYTIQGKGNYQGTAKTLEYVIEPKTITINPNSQIKIKNKPYDENNKFELSGVEFNSEVISADRSEVKLEVGYVSSANVGTYTRITFDPKDLSGSKGSNYTFAEGTGLDLNPAVEIEQVIPTVYTPTASYEPNADLNAFICTVEINKQPGIDYEFKMDEDGDWRAGTPSEDGSKCTSPAFADIAPLSKHTFYVRSIGNDNVKQVDMDNVEVEFKKLPNPNKAPESCELAFTANSDGRTFTATITPAGLEGAQYCIKPTDADDSQLITLDSNTYANCAPLTSYTAYIRYPGNDVYEPSEAATATAETEKAPLADAKPQYTPVLTRINASNPTDEYMTSDLRSMYGTMSDVLSDMAKRLSEDYPDIYSHDRIEYYELNLMVQRYNPDGTLSEPTPATEDDFKQADGSFGSITVQLKASDLPSGTNPNRNTYAIAHMFATPIGSHFAGDIETSPGTPGGGGITFDVNGTSPIAIAYSAANNSEDPGNDPGNEDPGNDPGNEDPGNEDPGNEDPGNDPGTEDPGNDPNGDNNNNGNTDNNGNNGNTDNNGNTGNNGDTGTTGGTDGNGTNGGTGTTGGTDGNGTNGGTGTTGTGGNSAVDALKSAAASLLPKTGDTSKIIVWVIAAIAACIAVVAVIRNNSKKGKAATAAASGGKATASTKKTAATAAKKSTTTAAKKTTTSTKKTTAAATKKTTTTKKGR